MCQLTVRLIKENAPEEVVAEVTHIAATPGNITLLSLFSPPRDLAGYHIQEIDCLRGNVVLTQGPIAS